MEGKDNIKELFSQKLGNYEAPVNPELWAKISSQVAAGATTTAATGLSMFAKVAIGIGISAAAITTVVVLSSTPEEVVLEEVKGEAEKEVSVTKPSQKEEVAELSTDKEINSIQYSDVNQYLGNTSNTDETPQSNDVLVDPKPTGAQDRVSDPSDFEMPLRTAETITERGTSEPTIVEGITYGEMTNYGATPTNTPDPELETPQTNVEPIKRYVNIFTPNGDGKNDYFALESEGLTDFSVVVFNPKGDIVFQTNDPSFRWDGRDMRSGELVDSGNYMYMVSAYDSEGNPFPIYERLTINR